ncbi:hypothetical protein [Sphingomonas sp. PB4P5]|uniref:hypothetical protein n=1 Tax=Parasphingomonas puruogangriensis TaxID=3096155 RepID=UPI002FCB6C80
MRIALISAATIALVSISACSRAPESPQSESAQSESLQTSDIAAPGINITAAPGVAFAYRYAFRLPPKNIASAQENHASACEKLGVARCRITGMRYQLIGENDIRAMLAFKLDPTLARAFGKEGIAAIEKADGKLIDAEITGTDAGAEIAQLSTGKARVADELARIDKQLARGDLPASERAELQRQRGELVATIAAASANLADQRASLATTPMTFDYESGAGIRGFDASAPLTSALDTFLSSAQTTLAFVLGFIAIFGPPMLAALLLWLLWRQLRPFLPTRLRRTDGTPVAPRPAATMAPPPGDRSDA